MGFMFVYSNDIVYNLSCANTAKKSFKHYIYIYIYIKSYCKALFENVHYA